MSASTAAASARRRAAVGLDRVPAPRTRRRTVAGASDVTGASASARGHRLGVPVGRPRPARPRRPGRSRAAATPARWPMRRYTRSDRPSCRAARRWSPSASAMPAGQVQRRRLALPVADEPVVRQRLGRELFRHGAVAPAVLDRGRARRGPGPGPAPRRPRRRARRPGRRARGRRRVRARSRCSRASWASSIAAAPQVAAGQRGGDAVLVQLLRPVERPAGPRDCGAQPQRVALPPAVARADGEPALLGRASTSVAANSARPRCRSAAADSSAIRSGRVRCRPSRAPRPASAAPRRGSRARPSSATGTRRARRAPRLAVRARRPLQRGAQVVTLAVRGRRASGRSPRGAGGGARGGRGRGSGGRGGGGGRSAPPRDVAARANARVVARSRNRPPSAWTRLHSTRWASGSAGSPPGDARRRRPGRTRRGTHRAAGTGRARVRAAGRGSTRRWPSGSGGAAPRVRPARSAVVEPVGQRVQRQRRGPRGGQLHRERQPVEAAADLGDDGRVRPR